MLIVYSVAATIPLPPPRGDPERIKAHQVFFNGCHFGGGKVLPNSSLILSEQFMLRFTLLLEARSRLLVSVEVDVIFNFQHLAMML